MKLTSKVIMLRLFFKFVHFRSSLAFLDRIAFIKSHLILSTELNRLLVCIFKLGEYAVSVDVFDSLENETLRMVAGLSDMLVENAHLLIL